MNATFFIHRSNAGTKEGERTMTEERTELVVVANGRKSGKIVIDHAMNLMKQKLSYSFTAQTLYCFCRNNEMS
jgi:hypothetical protein